MMCTRGNMSGFAVLILIVILCPRIRRVSCKLIGLQKNKSQSITKHTDGKWDSEKDEFTRNTTIAVKEVIPYPMRIRLGLPGRNCWSQKGQPRRQDTRNEFTTTHCIEPVLAVSEGSFHPTKGSTEIVKSNINLCKLST
jgi:hypothetical protein